MRVLLQHLHRYPISPSCSCVRHISNHLLHPLRGDLLELVFLNVPLAKVLVSVLQGFLHTNVKSASQLHHFFLEIGVEQVGDPSRLRHKLSVFLKLYVILLFL